MKIFFIRILTILCILPVIFITCTVPAFADPQPSQEDTSGLPLTAAPVALLMDTATGTVIYEKNATEERPLASVTKLMTRLLIFQALEEGKFQLHDDVTVSAHAAGMGGSQV